MLREPLVVTDDRLEEILEKIFAAFETRKDPVLEVALREAKQFCRDMASADVPARWLVMTGKSGVGKTMLARCVTRFVRNHLDCLQDERNGPADRWTRRGGFKPWVDVVGEMLGGDFIGLLQLSNDWFLALDDIGTENKNIRELSISKLFEVLNRREFLWTVLTANLSVEQIGEVMDTRIASRLLRNRSSVIDMTTIDFNLRTASIFELRKLRSANPKTLAT